MSVFSQLRDDVKYTIRQFKRQPRFWSVVVATLTLGIAGSTSLFAVVDGVLLKPLPYPAHERLVRLKTSGWRGEYFELERRAKTMDVAAYYPSHQEVTVNIDGAEPLRLPASSVTSDFFDVLGIRPELGRAFTPEETHIGGPGITGGTQWRTYGVVIVSAPFWRSYFSGRPDVIGRSISIDGVQHTVVGVMPAGFAFPSADVAFWFPHNIDPAALWSGAVATTIGRLRPGSGIEDAREELHALLPTFRELIPWGDSLKEYGKTADVISLTDDIVGGSRPTLVVLLVAIGVLLLLACANVANLLLARAAVRERELATRTALGALRGRLVRQLFVENMTVAAVSGLIGTLLAALALQSLVGFLPVDLPRVNQIGVDWRLLTFAIGVSIATGVLFGSLPALRATRPGRDLPGRGRGTVADAREGRLSGTIAAVEVALAVALVVAATLLLRSFWNLTGVDPGFDAEQLVTARVAPPGFYDAAPARKNAFAASVIERVETAPGVRSVAAANAIPFDAALIGTAVQKEGAESTERIYTVFMGVTASYFATMRTAMLEGRSFDGGDRADSPRVAIVSRNFARTNWGGDNPIGKRIRFPIEPRQYSYGQERTPWFTIVGVADDVRVDNLSSPTNATLYLPLEQYWHMQSLRVIVRTADSPERVNTTLRSTVATIDPLAAISDVRPYSSRLSDNIARPRLAAYILGAFAAIAVFLSAIGIYGVLSYALSRRVPEIGVRMALGADGRTVFRLLFSQGFRVTLLGVGIGIPLAAAATRLLSGLLFGVDPFSVELFAGVTIAVLLIGLGASYLPARRAAGVDPMQALRQD